MEYCRKKVRERADAEKERAELRKHDRKQQGHANEMGRHEGSWRWREKNVEEPHFTPQGQERRKPVNFIRTFCAKAAARTRAPPDLLSVKTIHIVPPQVSGFGALRRGRFYFIMWN